MTTPVWVYWQGPMPEYIRLCIDTMAHCCAADVEAEFHLVNKANFHEFVPEGTVNERWRDIPEEGVASDCVRAALLSEHGGVYLDADTICLQSPRLMCEAGRLVYSTWQLPPRRAIAGYLAAPRYSSIIRDWLAAQNEILENDFDSICWLSLGERLLTPIIDRHADEATWVDRRTFLPIDIDASVGVFFAPEDWRAFTLPETVCYGLNHSWFMSRKPKQITAAPETWADSPLLIHQLLEHARGMIA